MKSLVFASRNFKEIIRDKINLFFGLAFPVIIFLMLSLIQKNIPVKLFEPEQLTPGIAVFGLSFISLFSGMLIAKDRSSAFIVRLYVSPMKPKDFILGYTLPIIPLAAVQTIVCYIAGICMGMKITLNLLLAIILLIPADFLYIGLGLLLGSVLNEKQVGTVCGAVLTNLSAWLSGAWFDVALGGKVFETIAYILPFANAVDMGRAAVSGSYADILKPFIIVAAYAVVIYVAAVAVYSKKMKSDNK